MMSYCKNLPLGTNNVEFKRFLEHRLRAAWMISALFHPKVVKANVLRVKDRTTGTWECQGLIRILPDICGKPVLRHLNGVKFYGRELAVRPYFPRHGHDRRVAYTDPRLLSFPDRREQTRRRENLLFTTARHRVRANDPFSSQRGSARNAG